MTPYRWPIDEIDYQLRERVGELVEYVSGQRGVRRGNDLQVDNPAQTAVIPCTPSVPPSPKKVN